MNFKKDYDVWDVILVLIGLIPVYLDDGFSINYSFVLIPFFSGNIKLKVYNNFLIYLACFFLMYFCSFIYVNAFLPEKLDRSLISFLLFMSPFLWGAFEINIRFYRALLLGILVFSLSFSFWQIYTVLKNLLFLNLSDFYSLKDIVGSNRISFILIFAYFITRPLVKGKVLFISKMILTLGILLTFSRAALLTFIVAILFELFLKKKLFKPQTIIITSLSPILFGLLLYYLIPGGEELITFFYERIIERFTGNSYSITSNTTSEGIRLETWANMIRYLVDNFLLFTGTGYLGPWILSNIQVSSSHNQFMDVLFRSGIIGIALVYIPLIQFMFSKRRIVELRIIVFILLFYGLFHESFKETQGALLLAIIFSMFFNPIKKINHERTESLY